MSLLSFAFTKRPTSSLPRSTSSLQSQGGNKAAQKEKGGGEEAEEEGKEAAQKGEEEAEEGKETYPVQHEKAEMKGKSCKMGKTSKKCKKGKMSKKEKNNQMNKKGKMGKESKEVKKEENSACPQCAGMGWVDGWVCFASAECIEASKDLDNLMLCAHQPSHWKKKSKMKRPASRSGKRKPGQKQLYKLHMLAGQAKDLRIKDLEAELQATKIKLEAETRGRLEALARILRVCRA